MLIVTKVQPFRDIQSEDQHPIERATLLSDMVGVAASGAGRFIGSVSSIAPPGTALLRTY